jgi:hypothetical protein
VRKAWLRRQAVLAAAPPVPAATPPRARTVGAVRPPALAPAIPAAAPAVSWDDVEAAARGRLVPPPRPVFPGPPAAAPAKVAAPRPATPRPVTVSAATVARAPAGPRTIPIGLILGGAAVVLVGMVAIAMTRRSTPSPPAPSAAAAPVSPPRVTAPSQAATPLVGEAAGPLATADSDLRQAVESVLAAYARALETADADLLAQARSDLTPEERARLVAPFTGAVNAATDLRVLSVTTRGDLAVVTILRTEVIVGGSVPSREPTEETLRFWRRRGEWLLVR